MLISEAGGPNKPKKKKEDYNSKDRDGKSDKESHVEMDSRLLTALLTVSISAYINIIFLDLYHIFNGFLSSSPNRESIELFLMSQAMKQMTLLNLKLQCFFSW